MNKDLSNLTVEELRQLEQKIAAEVKVRERQAVDEARQQIAAIAANVGLPLAAILDVQKAGSKKHSKPAAVKYRHPSNSSQQWTGRGRQPRWVKEWAAGGKSIDELHVSS